MPGFSVGQGVTDVSLRQNSQFCATIDKDSVPACSIYSALKSGVKENIHERKTTLDSGCSLVWHHSPPRPAEALPRTAEAYIGEKLRKAGS